MEEELKIWKGNLIHCLSLKDEDFRIEKNCVLGVNSKGVIVFLEKDVSPQKLKELAVQFHFEVSNVIDLKEKFLIPGFIDTHIHAPQYSFTGTGIDLGFPDWLNKYTFPIESKFKDLSFTEQVYRKVIFRTLSYGTTTACYFATIHLQSCEKLADYAQEIGQRAFIGKVCMDQYSPEYYVESTDASVKETEAFIQYTQSLPLITPVVTPRFVPTCSSELMQQLGVLASKYQVPIQSHISENKQEVEWVQKLYPDIPSYTQVYDKFGLINDKTIMAHGIYLSDEELEIFRQRKAGISHCPVSNFFHSGILDAKRVLQKQVKLGLGTDVSGGYSPSILEVIRQALIASNSFQFSNSSYVPLTYREVFALATLGGSQVLGIDHLVGNFVVGKVFDALLIDPKASDSPFDIFEIDSFEDIFQKFIFLGDDRNISSVFVQGKEVLKRKS